MKAVTLPGSSKLPELSSAFDPRKAMRSAGSLGVRQILVYSITLASNILLARILSPSEYGLLAIVSFSLNFLVVFGGTGLAANLIRQAQEPTERDYRVVFSLQQAIVLLVVLSVLAFSPLLASAYNLPHQDAWVFRLLGCSVLATSFMVVPQVRMERQLAFDRLAAIEVAQSVLYNVSVVGFALRGFHEMSFAIAMLIRSLTGSVLANIACPWKPGFLLDWKTAREHLAFGMNYQGAQLVSLLKDSFTPLLIGLYAGQSAVGYVSWAASMAAYPIWSITFLQRLYMPVFGRLQNQKSKLSSAVAEVFWGTYAIVAILSILSVTLIRPITILVFGAKWLPALPLFYLFWGATLFAPGSAPCLALLNAVGKARLALGYSVCWMIGTWLLGVPLVYAYGIIGFGIATLVLQSTNFALFSNIKQIVDLSISKVLLPIGAISSIVLAGLFVTTRVVALDNIPRLVALGSSALLVYMALLGYFCRERLWRYYLLAR